MTTPPAYKRCLNDCCNRLFRPKPDRLDYCSEGCEDGDNGKMDAKHYVPEFGAPVQSCPSCTSTLRLGVCQRCGWKGSA